MATDNFRMGTTQGDSSRWNDLKANPLTPENQAKYDTAMEPLREGMEPLPLYGIDGKKGIHGRNILQPYNDNYNPNESLQDRLLNTGNAQMMNKGVPRVNSEGVDDSGVGNALDALRAERDAGGGKDNGYWENIARGGAATFAKHYISSADAIADTIGYGIEQTIGSENLSPKTLNYMSYLGYEVNKDTGKLDNVLFNNADEAANTLMGYDAGKHQPTLDKFTNTLDKTWENDKLDTVEKIKRTAKAAWDAKEAIPEQILNSYVYLKRMATGKGFAATVAGESNAVQTERDEIAVAKAKETGEPLKLDDFKDKVIVTGITGVKVGTDKIIDTMLFKGQTGTTMLKDKLFGIATKATKPESKGIIKSLLTKSLAVTGKTAEAAVTEYGTEGLQTAMEIYAKKFDGDMLMDGELQAEFTDKEWKEIKAGAAIGALTGAGQSVAGQIASTPTGAYKAFKENGNKGLIGEVADTARLVGKTAKLTYKIDKLQKIQATTVDQFAKRMLNTQDERIAKGKGTADAIKEGLDTFFTRIGSSAGSKITSRSKVLNRFIAEAYNQAKTPESKKAFTKSIEELRADPELAKTMDISSIGTEAINKYLDESKRAIDGMGNTEQGLKDAITSMDKILGSLPFDDKEKAILEKQLVQAKELLSKYQESGGKDVGGVSSEISDIGFLKDMSGVPTRQSLSSHLSGVSNDMLSNVNPKQSSSALSALNRFVSSRPRNLKLKKGYDTHTDSFLESNLKDNTKMLETIEDLITVAEDTLTGDLKDSYITRLNQQKKTLTETNKEISQMQDGNYDNATKPSGESSATTPPVSGETTYVPDGATSTPQHTKGKSIRKPFKEFTDKTKEMFTALKGQPISKFLFPSTDSKGESVAYAVLRDSNKGKDTKFRNVGKIRGLIAERPGQQTSINMFKPSSPGTYAPSIDNTLIPVVADMLGMTTKEFKSKHSTTYTYTDAKGNEHKDTQLFKLGGNFYKPSSKVISLVILSPEQKAEVNKTMNGSDIEQLIKEVQINSTSKPTPKSAPVAEEVSPTIDFLNTDEVEPVVAPEVVEDTTPDVDFLNTDSGEVVNMFETTPEVDKVITEPTIEVNPVVAEKVVAKEVNPEPIKIDVTKAQTTLGNTQAKLLQAQNKLRETIKGVKGLSDSMVRKFNAPENLGRYQDAMMQLLSRAAQGATKKELIVYTKEAKEAYEALPSDAKAALKTINNIATKAAFSSAIATKGYEYSTKILDKVITKIDSVYPDNSEQDRTNELVAETLKKDNQQEYIESIKRNICRYEK